MHDYINPNWSPLLESHGLAKFDALWRLEVPWFEEPNQRRGGWSGVARFELTQPDGSPQGFFLKRQENHGTFSWRHPVRGVPTFLREFRKIMHYQACGIPSLEPVFFAMRQEGSNQRAILVTAELAGFVSMEDRAKDWLEHGAPPRAVRQQYLHSVGSLLQAMHRHGIQHNCFFPKHVFTKMLPDGRVESRVIDLEKSRWRPLQTLSARRDLYSLVRQSMQWGSTDRLRFFKHYLGIDRLTPYAKWLWRDIDRRSLKKNRLQRITRQLIHREK